MTIIDDALPYRRRGFSVIPIKPRDKKPLVSWEPYQKEPASEGTINHWFQSWPNANLGIVTGAVSDTVVIDLDSQEAKEKIKSLLPNYGLGSVPRVRTGRGGYHLFFKHPGSVVETRTGVLPKTDVRGDGGLVVAAPSIHENGKRYAWEVPLSGALPDLPPELLELISKPSINGNGTHKHFDPSTVWEGIPEGQRDETLFKYACQMRHNNAPRELAERLILEAAARCKPPFPEADALKKLDQAWRYNPGHSAAESNNAKSIQAAITEAIFIKMADVTPKKLHWLWQGRIPLGKVTVLDGDPGLGKSLISVDLAGYLTTGRPMPNMAVADIAEPAGAVFLSAEDDVEDTIQPRLNIAGADLNRVVYLKAVKRNGEIWMPSITDLDAMKDAARAVNAKLIVVDPLMAYLPAETNSYRDQDVCRSLAPLAALAAELDVSILVIRHLNKPSNNNPIYRGGGSIGIIGAARSGLMVAKDPDDDSRCILSVVKSNLAKMPPSLAYEILSTAGEVPFIKWLGPTEHTAASLLSDQADSLEDRSALHEAEEFLSEYLAAMPRKAIEVVKASRAAGIAEKTLRRGKHRLKIWSRRNEFKGEYFWGLPDQKDDPSWMANLSMDGQMGAL